MSALSGENGQNGLRVKSNSKEPLDPSTLRELTHQSLWLDTCSEQVWNCPFRLALRLISLLFIHLSRIFHSTVLCAYPPRTAVRSHLSPFILSYQHLETGSRVSNKSWNISCICSVLIFESGRSSSVQFMFPVFICCVITTHTLHFNPFCSLKTDKYACKVLCWHA